MDWRTFFASTGVATAIAAIPLVKSLIDNKAKANDAIKSFRYTKLHEIVVDWQENMPNLSLKGVKGAKVNEKVVNHYLERCVELGKRFNIAKPLVDDWDNVENKLKRLSGFQDKALEEHAQGSFGQEFVQNFIYAGNEAEQSFISAIEKQMRALLK